MLELKPCPFCGGKPFLDELGDLLDSYGNSYSIICSICKATPWCYSRDKQEIMKKWNKRISKCKN